MHSMLLVLLTPDHLEYMQGHRSTLVKILTM
jgi:hypothetical protein